MALTEPDTEEPIPVTNPNADIKFDDLMDPQFIRKATPEEEAALDAALGLRTIQVRVSAETAEALDAMAARRGIITQALVRDILTWAAGFGPDF